LIGRLEARVLSTCDEACEKDDGDNLDPVWFHSGS
jgi:hypothetical protein